MENKENYYIFLDIDGTLWDKHYACIIRGYPAINYIATHPDTYPGPLKASSMQAINLLLREIEKKYNTVLVITSKRRRDMGYCIYFLKENGLEYDKPILCTPYSNSPSRGQKILDYINENESTKLKPAGSILNQLFELSAKNRFKNFVVIDDDKSQLNKEIPLDRRIFANHDKKSLTIKQVVNYLKRNKLLSSESNEQQPGN